MGRNRHTLCTALVISVFGCVSCAGIDSAPSAVQTIGSLASSPVQTATSSVDSLAETIGSEESETEAIAEASVADYVAVATPLLRDLEDWQDDWERDLCGVYIASPEQAEGVICGLQMLNAKFIAGQAKTTVSALMQEASPMYKGAPPDSIKQSVAEVLLYSIRIGTAYDDYSKTDCSKGNKCASYAVVLQILVDRMIDNLSTWEAYNH